MIGISTWRMREFTNEYDQRMMGSLDFIDGAYALVIEVQDRGDIANYYLLPHEARNLARWLKKHSRVPWRLRLHRWYRTLLGKYDKPLRG